MIHFLNRVLTRVMEICDCTALCTAVPVLTVLNSDMHKETVRFKHSLGIYNTN